MFPVDRPKTLSFAIDGFQSTHPTSSAGRFAQRECEWLRASGTGDAVVRNLAIVRFFTSSFHHFKLEPAPLDPGRLRPGWQARDSINLLTKTPRSS